MLTSCWVKKMNAGDLAKRTLVRLQAPADYRAAIERQDGESDADYNARMIALADSSGGSMGVIVFQSVPARSAPPLPDEPREPVKPTEGARWVVPFVL